MSWRWWCGALAAVGLAACSSSSDDAGATTATTTTVATSPSASASATIAAPTGAPTVPTSAAPTVPTSAAPTSASMAPPTSTAPPPAPSSPPGVAPVGFELVAGRVTAADGATCDVCLWLAADPGARAQGLMGVTDLSGADGMVFRWDEPTSGNFWMRDTPTPLSIAFFAADGTFVSSADMVPCLAPTPDADCARYDAAGPYRYAVEVASGGLAALLMTEGSRLELLTGGCPRSP